MNSYLDFGAEAQIQFARWKLSRSAPEDVVMWAAEALAAGQDRPALVQLAIIQQPLAGDIERYFSELFASIGTTQPDDLAAARLIAKEVVTQIIASEVSPIAGALELRDIALNVPEAEPELLAFSAMASEWQDDIEHREMYESDIVEEAMRYVADQVQ